MVSEDTAPQGGRRLEDVLAAMRESAKKTMKYFVGSAIFYSVLIAVFAVLLAFFYEEPEDRGFAIGVLILLGLGFLGMWISALRGLRDPEFQWGRFLNLAYLPLPGRLRALEDASLWSGGEERLAAAEETFARRVAEEREMQAWPNRMLSIAVITVIDLLIWLVWDNLLSAVINQVVAMIVSQVHITLAPKSCLKLAQASPGGS